MAKPKRDSIPNIFYDRENKLSWEKYNKKRAEDFSAYNEFVNTWSQARNVQEYITRRQPIADYFTDFISTDDDNMEGLFYCTTKDDLVGVAYIISPMEGEDKTHIEYLVVNPRMQGKGIGTRMIKSIKHNPGFFTNGKHKGVLYASIENSNEPSIRAFLKNGFDVVRPAQMSTTGIVNGRYDPTANCIKYTRVYYADKKLIADNESELSDEE